MTVVRPARQWACQAGKQHQTRLWPIFGRNSVGLQKSSYIKVNAVLHHKKLLILRLRVEAIAFVLNP
jgi:hypothetical protein